MILVLITSIVSLLFGRAFSESECSKIKNCGECIGFAYDSCVWCLAENYEGNRCGVNIDLNKTCKDIYPKLVLENINIVKNNDFSSEPENIVQVRPQHVTIRTRPGIKHSLEMSYKPAKDYPIDIYFLIDNSFTMIRHKKQLAKEAERIPNELSYISNNVQMGVGTFIEKPALPFAVKGNKIVYSYQNNLALSKNMTQFTDAILNNKEGSNLDDPESGFDGLMQTMVCGEEVGWRNNSRRVIVMLTDNIYHSAGDGKFVGAFKVNDENCHLVDNQYDGLTYDYPSVGQINKVAIEHGFSIIFAATADAAETYKELAKEVKWSIFADLGNSSIVDIIKEEYIKLSQLLYLNTVLTSNVELVLTPSCSESHTAGCGIKYKEIKNITVTVKAKACTKEPGKVEIRTQTGDKLIIDVEAICECDCEKTGIVNDSPKCSFNGTLQCAICKCNDNRYGDICECDATSSYDKKFMDKCKMDGNNSISCNDRGVCSCGTCRCFEGFSGPFCQYDMQRCKNSNGEVCSNHGKCVDAQCECDLDGQWSGDYCNCQNQRCTAPFSTQECSGRGVCDCGKCICNNNNTSETEGLFLGPFCDECETCLESRCEELNSNIEKHCFIKDYNVTCATTIEYELKVTAKESLIEYENAKWCNYKFLNDCSIIYKFKYVSNDVGERKLVLIVQDKEECPDAANIWIAIGASIGTILLIGLLTAIVWKILVDRLDKKEYDKFVAESAAAGYDVAENPLYRDPQINFTNPAFQPSTGSL